MRKSIIAGNWKMNKLTAEVEDFITNTLKNWTQTDSEVVICAPFVYLEKLIKLTKDSDIKIGAQNMHFEKNGAYTGEISGEMLKDIGVEYVIIGHSERREYYNETNESVNQKTKKAISLGLIPIVCVGETEIQKENHETEIVVKEQIVSGLKDIKPLDIEKIIVAYEPIWAIGTGKVATSEDANQVISFIRKTINDNFGKTTSEKVRIQYGGSVKPDNIKDLLSQSDIDGALVGGASLKFEDFLALL